MEKKTIEQRLEALEKAVAELLLRTPLENGTTKNWVERITGSMEHIPKPVFDEFVRLGRQARKRMR